MSIIKPKKKLGQHFLNDLNIGKKIVESLKLDNYKRKLNINNLFDGNKKKIYLKINL